MEQKFFVSCLLIKDGQILMIKKEKGRHLGQWLFPGGEIKDHESPLDTVKRELSNDIGLELTQVTLRGLVHFMMQELPEDPVLAKTTLYVFYADEFSGEMKQSIKGTLEWVPITEMWDRKVGRHDELFIPQILNQNKVTFAKYYHDKSKKLLYSQID